MIKKLNGHDEKFDKMFDENLEMLIVAFKNKDSDLYKRLDEAFHETTVATVIGMIGGLVIGMPVEMLSTELNEDNVEEVLNKLGQFILDTFNPSDFVTYELKT